MHLSNKYMTTHFPGLVQLIGRTRNSEKDIQRNGKKKRKKGQKDKQREHLIALKAICKAS